MTYGRAGRRRPGLSLPASLALLTIGGILTGVGALRRRVAVVTVTGGSMLPAFAHGDRVLVRRAGVRDLRPGQVVVFQQPGRGADPVGGAAWDQPPARWAARSGGWMIKRVVAVPGDIRPPDCPPLPVPLGALVPPDGFVVRGDNVAVSLDSRKLGCIPASRLLGIAQRRLPPARTAAVPAAEPGRLVPRTVRQRDDGELRHATPGRSARTHPVLDGARSPGASLGADLGPL